MALALRFLVIAGLLASIAVTGLGMLVDRWPIFELFNHGRPAVALGTLAIAALAVITGRKALMIAAAALVVANIGLFAFALQGTAVAASGPAKRFARIVTFNVWMGNRHMDEVAKFLNDADADIVVTEELMPWQRDGLRYLVKDRYPYSIGRFDVVMFSRYPIKEAGEIRGRSSNPMARRAMLTWTTVEINGMTFDIAGVHNAYPFHAMDQAAYMPMLIEFARERERPLIVAGDFNLTPWSVKLQRFGADTGLRRFNTFTPTWPMNRRTLPPFVAIDNIFASPEFALIDIKAGPALGSDHRPLIADIALAK